MTSARPGGSAGAAAAAGRISPRLDTGHEVVVERDAVRAMGARAPRVLILVQNLPVPLDRRVWLESLALTEAGYEVSVICPRGDGQKRHQEQSGVHIYTYRPAPPAHNLLSYVWEFLYCWVMTALLSLRVRRERGFDVIQSCNPPDTFWALGWLYKTFAGKRYVFDHHDLCPEVYRSRFGRDSGLLLKVLLWLERRNFRTADVVVSTNDSYKSIAVSRGSRRPDEVYVVRSGPDPLVMRPGVAEDDLKRGKKHLAVWLGIMGPQDGVDGLLDVINLYVRDLGRDDCQFALLGFGDCEADLRRRASELELDEYVTFTGRVDSDGIRRYLSTASVGLSPDPKNPLNDVSTMNKTMEYMSFGLPVVAYDLRETRISAQDAAVYVEPGDKLEFARQIGQLLDDELMRRRIGTLGRARVVEELAWQRQVASYLDAFDRALSVDA